MADFVAALRNLAEHCETDRDTLEMMLGERIVCGIRDEEIQQRRLVEKNLKFQKGYEIFNLDGDYFTKCGNSSGIQGIGNGKQGHGASGRG